MITKREMNMSNQFGNNFSLKWEMILKKGIQHLKDNLLLFFLSGVATSVQSPLKLSLNWFCKWHQKGKSVVFIPFTFLLMLLTRGLEDWCCFWQLPWYNQHTKAVYAIILRILFGISSLLILLSQGGLYILGHVQEDEFNSEVRQVFFKIYFCFCFVFFFLFFT